jgi:IS30 family transposase
MARGALLTFEDRETISRELSRNRNCSTRFLGALVGKHHSAVAREINVNGGRTAYRAGKAHGRAIANRPRPRPRKLESSTRLHDAVDAGLRRKWSPRQISRRLRRDHPHDREMRVSHETIYECLYLQARGELRTRLKLELRRGRTQRLDPARSARTRRYIKNMVNISERPKEADDRAVPGFWEGDLIIGRGNASQIATLVERQTRLVLLVKIPYDRSAPRVAARLAAKMETLPEFMRKSVTWDQGREMARHEWFTMRTGMPVYFCDPHSPWQRGSNENTNGLLRQYFPKGEDLSRYTQAHLDKVAAELNGRPRQTLDWRTPLEVYNDLITAHLSQ